MSEPVVITIDGKEVKGRPGQTILEAAEDAGIYVPRLCHAKGLTPHGSCRVCTVKVNARPQAACTTPVAPGMVIENDTPELLEVRRALIEMLFVEGNHYCMFCEKSGNCELQALGYRFGITAPRYAYLFPERELEASHPDLFLDRNRCILCARCVGASRELDGKSAFGFVGRGAHKKLAVNSRTGLNATGAAATDRAAQACPVGALLKKRVGFAQPIGKRLYDHSPIGSDVESCSKANGKQGA
jgi:[NiFe] hydrogenase diaphorase moiety small subunit